MNLYGSVAICFIPLVAFFVCLFLLVKNFRIHRGLLACLMGLLSVVPIAAIQFFFDKNKMFTAASLGALLVESILFNGLIEELIKMSFLFVLPAKKSSLSEFFSYALLAGLSVGCFESVIYLISGYENIGLRMITAVLIHTTCSGLSGLFVYAARNKRLRVLPVILSVLIHGVYNYFAGFSTGIKYFSIAVILFSVIECRIRFRNVDEDLQKELTAE